MLTQRRPPSKSFSGTAPSVDKLKDERVGAIQRARKQGLIAFNSTANRTKGTTTLRRTVSLPDCKEMKVLWKSNPKLFADSLNGLKRVRSVSFAPEVELACGVADNDLVEVKQLIEKYNMNLDHQNASGLAAIHYAALEGSYECLELLVRNGASIDLIDYKGCSPLDFAVHGGHFDCAAYLIKAGAEITKIVNGLR